MRVLLDENLPHRLRHSLPGHEVTTVRYRGWAGVKNGELLRLAEADCFDVLMTADRNIEFQQNLRDRSLGFVCLTALDWEVILPHLDKVRSAVDKARAGSFQVVECGEFRLG